MNIQFEKIQSYVNYAPNIPERKTLWASIIMMLMVSIPSALFGMYSKVTSVILLPMVVVYSIWALYLLIETEKKKVQFVLYLGLFSVYISCSFILGAFKFVSTLTFVPWHFIVITIGILIIVNIINIMNIIRLIKKGYYLQSGKTENPIGLIVALAILGLGIGRVMVGGIKQDAVVIMISTLLMMMGFMYSIGIHNLVKYYFIQKYPRLKNNNAI